MSLSGKRRPCHFNGNRLYFAQGWQEKLKEIGLVQGSCWDKLEPGELVTRSQRLRFLYAYCGPGTTHKEIKKLAEKINRHLQQNPPKRVKPTKRL